MPTAPAAPVADEPVRRARGRPKDAIPREQRRESILGAARDVVMADGVAATMDTIARQAGVTKPVIYAHFGDKTALFDAVAAAIADDLAARVGTAVLDPGPARSVLFRSIDAFLTFIEHNRVATEFLIEHRTGGDAALIEVGRRAGAVLEARLTSGGLDNQPAELWGHGLVGFVVVAGVWWSDTGGRSRAEVAESLTHLLWDGLSGAGLT